MSEPVLEARGLSAKLPGAPPRTIYSSLDLTVAEGESIAIVGRSGAGKTTLLSTLGLLQPPDGGSLKVLGEETAALSDAARARLRNRTMGFVFQDYALIRELDVRRNLEMPFNYSAHRPPRERSERVAEALDMVGLGAHARARAARLSGGEQQRVAIARAIITRPAIVLADEPTGALDVRTGEEIIELLKQASSGARSCLVVVTHDAQVAAAMDRVFHLDGEGLHSEDDTVGMER